MSRSIISTFRLASLCGLTLVTTAANAQNPGLDKWVGKKAPQFTLIDINGKKHTNASLKGKVVLLDFWATWCVPCMAASPTMQKLHTTYGSKGLVVVGADTFEQTDPTGKSNAVAYKKKHGYTYTFAYNNDALAGSLKIGVIPAFVLIDKNGIVRNVWTGLPKNGGASKLQGVMEGPIKALLAK